MLHFRVPAKRTTRIKQRCFINNFNGRANCFKCGTLRARGEAFALDAKGLTMVGTLPCDTLLIRELPASADDLSVRHAVVRFTDVEPLNVRLAASRLFAFIQMGSLFDAEMAHHKLQRTCLYIDNCAVFVSFSCHSLAKVLSEGRIKLLPETQEDVQIIDQTTHNQSSSSSTANSVNTPFGILPICSEPDPAKFQYEHSSGYFYDPATGFYHDPKTEFYYSAKSRSWKFWCRKYRTYIDCEGGDMELKRHLQEDEREQVGQTLVDGPPPSEAQHRHALRHAPPPPNPPGGGGSGGSNNKVSSTPAKLRSTNGNNNNNNKRPRPPLLELESDDDDAVVIENAMQTRDAIGRAMPRHEVPRKRTVLEEEENGNGGGEQQRMLRPPPKQRFMGTEEEKVMTTQISREDLGQLVSALVKRGIDEEWRNLRNKRRSSRSRSRSPPRHGGSSKRDEHWRDGGGGRESDRSPPRHGKRDEHWRGDGRESDRRPSRRRDESRSSRDTSRERRRTHEFRQHQHQLLQQDQEPMTISSSPSPPPPAVVPFERQHQQGRGVPSSSSSRGPIPAPMFASSPVPPQPRGSSPFLAAAPAENSPFMPSPHQLMSPAMFPPLQMPPHNLSMMLQHGGIGIGGGGQPPFNNNNNSPMFVPRMPTPSSLGLRLERAAAAAMQMGTTPGVPRGYVGPPSASSSAGPKLFFNNTLREQQLRYPAALSSAGASRALPSSAFGGGLPGTFPSSSGNRRGAAPPSKASVVNQLDVDQQQKKSQLISKERDKVNSLGICLNCGRHGHNLFQCRWERISDDELQKKLRDAKQKLQRQELDKQELKRRADKHPLRRKDPLIERLRVAAPHGKIKMEYIRTICPKCAYFNHTRMECSRADIGRILHKQICNQLEEFKKVFFVHLLEDRMVDLSQKFDTFRVMDGIELNGTIDPVGLQLQAMCPDGIVTQMDLRELCSNCAMLGHKRTECKEKAECSRTHYDKMLELVKGYRALVKEGNGNFVLPTAKMMNPPVLVLKDIERSEPIEEIILLDSSDDEEEETEKQGKEKEKQLGEEEKEKQREEEEKKQEEKETQQKEEEKKQNEEEKMHEEKEVEEIIMLDSNDDEAMEKDGEEKEKQLEDKEKPEEAQGEQKEEKETQREKEKQLGEKEMQIDELIVLESDDEEKEKQGEEREMPEEESAMQGKVKEKQAEEKETQGEKEKQQEEKETQVEEKKMQLDEEEKQQTEKDVEEIIMLDSNDDEEIEKEGEDKERQEEKKETQGEENEKQAEEKVTQGEEKEKREEEKETQGEEKEKREEEKEKQSEEEEKTDKMEKQQEEKEMQVEEVIMLDSNDDEAMKKQGEEKEKQLGDEDKTEEDKVQGDEKKKQLENDEKRDKEKETQLEDKQKPEEEKETQGEEKEKEK